MKAKLIVFALLLTVFSIVMVSIAIKSFHLTPQPNLKQIHEIIKKKSDSVGVAAIDTLKPDTTGLHKLQAFKKRLAAASLRRQLDSIARLQNK